MKSLRKLAAVGALGTLLGSLAVSGAAAPQDPPAPPATDEITLEKIMADPDWIGNAPEDPFWSADGRAVYYERKRQGQERKDLWRVDLAAAAPQKLDDREKGQ